MRRLTRLLLRTALVTGVTIFALAAAALLFPDQTLTVATRIAVAAVPLRLALADSTRLNGSTWHLSDSDQRDGIRLEHFASSVARDTVSYYIYLPPAYQTEPGHRFPVIYWLYGSGAGPRDGLDSFVRRMALLMDGGRIPPAIIVLPNLLTDSYFVDSRDGRWPVESVLIRDIIPEVDRKFRTIGTREARAIDGYSMGGFGAAHLGFKYPDTFGVVSITAGPLGSFAALAASPSGRAAAALIFGGSEDYFRMNSPAVLARGHADRLRAETKIQLAYGQDDTRLRPPMVAFDSLLTTLSIPHVVTVVPGANHRTFFSAPDDRPFLFYRTAFAALGRMP